MNPKREWLLFGPGDRLIGSVSVPRLRIGQVLKAQGERGGWRVWYIEEGPGGASARLEPVGELVMACASAS